MCLLLRLPLRLPLSDPEEGGLLEESSELEGSEVDGLELLGSDESGGPDPPVPESEELGESLPFTFFLREGFNRCPR